MSSSEISLEPMREEEIDEAVRLISLAMNEEEGGWARKTMRFHFGCKEHQEADGRDYFVWRFGQKIKGLVGLHHYIWGPGENVWLSWFAVHPDHQRQGIGRKLLRSIETIAGRKGYTKFLVETYRHSDFDKARAFYTQNGFKETGQISDYLPDGSEMIVYGKKIGNKSTPL
jgi:ribosomal protein S18 acetylase RimI-like enzyme